MDPLVLIPICRPRIPPLWQPSDATQAGSAAYGMLQFEEQSRPDQDDKGYCTGANKSGASAAVRPSAGAECPSRHYEVPFKAFQH
uniref:Uncharacterized protein n=1 Tax=Mycena chlorophos TaxID=658473 RepID=A0ABQ0LRQ6_MYCCL|nr:predicted protein [Mycena chlorophos]